MRTESNIGLWLSFKKGSWDAYAGLYNEFFTLLFNYGYKFTRDKVLIEDAIHDLFVRLWTTREKLSDPASIKNYLFKSLRHNIMRKMKGEEKFTDIDGNDFPLSFSIAYNNETSKLAEDRDLQQRLKVFIDSLPPRQQEIIYLRFYEGLSYEEIADIMSISINSAYKLLYKALANLQSTFGSSSALSIILHLHFFSKFFLTAKG